MLNLILVPVILFVVIGLYLLSYSWNNNTDAPEGTEPIGKCSSCGTSGSCSLANTAAALEKDNCEIEELKLN